MRLNALLAILLLSLVVCAALEPRFQSFHDPNPLPYNVWVESTPAFGPSTPSFWPANLAAYPTDGSGSDERAHSPALLPAHNRRQTVSDHKPVVIDCSLPDYAVEAPQPWTTLLNVLRYRAMKYFRPAILVLFDQPRFDEPTPIDKAVQYVVDRMREVWRLNRY